MSEMCVSVSTSETGSGQPSVSPCQNFFRIWMIVRQFHEMNLTIAVDLFDTHNRPDLTESRHHHCARHNTSGVDRVTQQRPPAALVVL